MMKHLLLVAVLAAGSMLDAVSPSFADCDGCVVGAVNNFHQDQTRLQSQTIDAVHNAEQAIVKAITRGVAQTSGYQAQTTDSQRRIENAAQREETVRQRQLARARAEGGRYDPAPSACTDLSGIIQFGGGQNAQGLGGNDLVNVARNRSRGNGSAGAATRAGGLAIARQIKNARDQYEGYGGYLDPTSDIRFLTESSTVDTTDEDQAKILAHLVTNIVDPTPARPITAAEAKTPQGLAQIADRQVDDARRSAADAVFAYLGDLAAPSGGKKLADWARRTAGPNYAKSIGDVISNQQAMDVFVRSRFTNPKWHEKLARMSPAAVARETALTEALNLEVNWMRFQLEKRMAVVGATSLATQLDASESSSTAITTSLPQSAGGG